MAEFNPSATFEAHKATIRWSRRRDHRLNFKVYQELKSTSIATF
jgi:hypothetical protein